MYELCLILRNGVPLSGRMILMSDRQEMVHVHKMDRKSTVEQYRKKGFVLKEETAATIPAQKGFVKLIFEAEDVQKARE